MTDAEITSAISMNNMTDLKKLEEKVQRLEKAVLFHAEVLDSILIGLGKGSHDHFGTHL